MREIPEVLVNAKTAELPIYTEERKENCLRLLRVAPGEPDRFAGLRRELRRASHPAS
jgi:hypothetical protein